MMLVLGERFMIWFAFHVVSCIRERIVGSICLLDAAGGLA